jgi:hypothetical protein
MDVESEPKPTLQDRLASRMTQQYIVEKKYYFS